MIKCIFSNAGWHIWTEPFKQEAEGEQQQERSRQGLAPEEKGADEKKRT
jgi:hypothetical protein